MNVCETVYCINEFVQCVFEHDSNCHDTQITNASDVFFTKDNLNHHFLRIIDDVVFISINFFTTTLEFYAVNYNTYTAITVLCCDIFPSQCHGSASSASFREHICI